MPSLTPAQAAKEFKETKAAIDELERRKKAAHKRLIEHFRQTGKSTYQGLGYSHSWYTALDVSKAREALGDDAASCEVSRERETITVLRS